MMDEHLLRSLPQYRKAINEAREYGYALQRIVDALEGSLEREPADISGAARETAEALRGHSPSLARRAYRLANLLHDRSLEPKTFHLTIIDHNQGYYVSVHTTETGAREDAYEWVAQEWADTFGSEPIPEDHAEAVDMYFHESEDEFLTVEQVVLHG